MITSGRHMNISWLASIKSEIDLKCTDKTDRSSLRRINVRVRDDSGSQVWRAAILERAKSNHCEDSKEMRRFEQLKNLTHRS